MHASAPCYVMHCRLLLLDPHRPASLLNMSAKPFGVTSGRISMRARAGAPHPNGVGRAALLHAARVGHHAVRAALVAAVDDVDPGAERAVALWHADVLRDGHWLHRHHLRPQVHLLQQLADPAARDPGDLSANTPGRQRLMAPLPVHAHDLLEKTLCLQRASHCIHCSQAHCMQLHPSNPEHNC